MLVHAAVTLTAIRSRPPTEDINTMTTHPATPTMTARSQPSQTMQALAALTHDVDCSPREWLSVVNRLPVLRQRILQRINASHATVPRPITALPQAIVNLGFNTVRNLARLVAR